MKTLIDFYDAIFVTLCKIFFASKEEEKITSALALVAAVEWFYFFDALIIASTVRNSTIVNWHVFRPSMLLFGLGLCAVNFAYIYPRRLSIQARFSNSDLADRYLVAVLMFTVAPLATFACLLLFF